MVTLSACRSLMAIVTPTVQTAYYEVTHVSNHLLTGGKSDSFLRSCSRCLTMRLIVNITEWECYITIRVCSIRTCKADNKRPERIIILMPKQSYLSLPWWIAVIQLWRWKSDRYHGGPSLIPRKNKNRYWNNLGVWRARKAARLQKPMTIIIRQSTKWNWSIGHNAIKYLSLLER